MAAVWHRLGVPKRHDENAILSISPKGVVDCFASKKSKWREDFLLVDGPRTKSPGSGRPSGLGDLRAADVFQQSLRPNLSMVP